MPAGSSRPCYGLLNDAMAERMPSASICQILLRAAILACRILAGRLADNFQQLMALAGRGLGVP